MIATSSSVNTNQSLAQLNAVLVANQLEPLVLHPSCSPESICSISRCVHAILTQRQKEKEFRDDAATAVNRMYDEMEHLEQKAKRISEAADRAEREAAMMQSKQQAAEQEGKRQLELLQVTVDQLTKSNTQLQYRLGQLQHKVARKEKDGEKLAEKVSRQVHDRERKAFSGPPALNETQDGTARCAPIRRKLECNVDTSMSDVYENNLVDYRTEISTLQSTLHAFSSELAQMTSQYSQTTMEAPIKEQYSAPLAYTQESIDEFFQSNLEALKTALYAIKRPPLRPENADSSLSLEEQSLGNDDPME